MVLSGKKTLLLLAGLLIGAPTVQADEQAPLPAGLPSDYQAGSTVTSGTNGQPLLPEGNPFSGLFTPQPQYNTPQAVKNPEPTIPQGNEKNPLGGLFTSGFQNAQPADSPTGTNNILKGVFTGQNPFQTPQAQQNPDGQAKNAMPGYGQPKLEELEKAGIKYSIGGQKDGEETAQEDSAKTGGTSTTATPGDKDKDKKDDKADKRDEKDKDKKDAKAGDKDKDKDKDKKDDKKDAKELTPEEKEKAKAKAEKEKEEKEKSEKEAEEKLRKALGPYDPIKDAAFLVQSGKCKMALDVLSEVLSKQPTNAQAQYLAAISYVGLRDYARAAEKYRTVLKLVPASSLAQLAVEGLKKIGMPATLSNIIPGKLPPLRQP